MAIAKVILNDVSQIDLTSDTVTAEGLLSGYTAHDASGTQITGTANKYSFYKDSDGYIVIGSEDCGVDGLVSKDSDGYIVIPEELITEIKLQGKTATPTEEYQAIYPDSGYDGLEYVGVNPIPSAYADVTDTTAVATDVAAGKIFYTSEGVRTSGTASGGGGDDVWSGMVDRTISQAIDSMGSFSAIGKYAFANCFSLSQLSFPNATIIESNAFQYCIKLSSIYFPNASIIGDSAFTGCKILPSADFPEAERIGTSAFISCDYLKTINAPKVSYIGNSAFQLCLALPSIVLPKATTISNYAFFNVRSMSAAVFGYDASSTQGVFGGSAFRSCYRLMSLYLLKSSCYSLSNINAFYSTPISTYTNYTSGVNGSIFVPESLYNSYITATNWSAYSSRFVSLTDAQVQHVIDCGTHEME